MAQISVLESLAREKLNISLNTDKTFPNEHGLQSAHNNSENQIKKIIIKKKNVKSTSEKDLHCHITRQR